MKNFMNIEKLPGKAHYTGYAAGTVWFITKFTKQSWKVVDRDYKTSIYERTLEDISKSLYAMDTLDK